MCSECESKYVTFYFIETTIIWCISKPDSWNNTRWRNTFASKQFIKKNNINNVNNYFTDQFRWLRTKRYLRF